MLRIIRTSKLDKAEEKLYKDTVQFMSSVLNDMKIAISKVVCDITADTAREFMWRFSEFTSAFMLYQNNKFSPIGEICYIENGIDQISSLLKDFARMVECKNRLEDDPEFHTQELRDKYDEVMRCIVRIYAFMYNMIEDLHRCLTYDIIKISLGVDIILEYYTNKKAKIHPWEVHQTIKFVKMNSRLRKYYGKDENHANE